MKQLILILLLTCSVFGQSNLLLFDDGGKISFANLSANIDTVWAGNYIPLNSGTPDLSSYNRLNREYFNYSQKTRIRQNGYITKIELYVDTLSLSQFDTLSIRFWRGTVATSMTLIGSTGNIKSLLSEYPLLSTVTLPTPVLVQEGDWYSIRIATADGSNFPNVKHLTSVTGVTNANLYYTQNTFPSGTFNWAGTGLNLANYAIPVKFYMQAPMFVTIGNSIIAGHTPHYTFLENTIKSEMDSTIAYWLSDYYSGYTYQNMGIGGQTTTQIQARFETDVTDLSPRFAVIEGGVNDIAGSVATSTIISKYTLMLDSLSVNNIYGVVLSILPWTNGTDNQNRQADTVNSQLQSLVSTYNNFFFVDVRSAVGQFRTGGDTGNLWDIKSEYDDDGVHLYGIGYKKVAETIYNYIK